jgi:DNA-binding NtrC family response regulator
VALETTDRVQLERLPPFGRQSDEESWPAAASWEEGLSLSDYLKDTERGLIEAALKATGGNQLRAAQRLNISYRSLRHRISVLGIRRAERPLAAPL